MVNYDVRINYVTTNSGAFQAIDNIWNTPTISFGQTLAGGDVLEVYIYSLAADAGITDQFVFADLITMTLVPYIDLYSVKITYAKASVTTLPAWDELDSGLPTAKTFTMNVGDSLFCVLYSFPNWITIVDGAGHNLNIPFTSSDPIHERHAITDGDTIFVYPTLPNNSNSQLTGTLVFLNEYGDTSSVTISQDLTPLYIPPSLIVHPSDDFLVILNGQTAPSSSNPYVIFGASLGVPEPNNLYLYAAFWDRLIEGYSQWFTIYWTATIVRIPGTTFRGFFNVMANEYWDASGYKLEFPTGTNIVATDVLVITLSINYI
jgi:hypothetical protein